MFTGTIQAKILQLFNKPYIDGTIVPFQENTNPAFIRRLGLWIARVARRPFKGKWLLSYIIIYLFVFFILYLAKGYKHIKMKPLFLVIIFNFPFSTIVYCVCSL